MWTQFIAPIQLSPEISGKMSFCTNWPRAFQFHPLEIFSVPISTVVFVYLDASVLLSAHFTISPPTINFDLIRAFPNILIDFV